MPQTPAFGTLNCEMLESNDPCTDWTCPWNTLCHVVCDAGYSMEYIQHDARSYFICGDDGQWDAPVPTCRGKLMSSFISNDHRVMVDNY